MRILTLLSLLLIGLYLIDIISGVQGLWCFSADAVDDDDGSSSSKPLLSHSPPTKYESVHAGVERKEKDQPPPQNLIVYRQCRCCCFGSCCKSIDYEKTIQATLEHEKKTMEDLMKLSERNKEDILEDLQWLSQLAENYQSKIKEKKEFDGGSKDNEKTEKDSTVEMSWKLGELQRIFSLKSELQKAEYERVFGKIGERRTSKFTVKTPIKKSNRNGSKSNKGITGKRKLKKGGKSKATTGSTLEGRGSKYGSVDKERTESSSE